MMPRQVLRIKREPGGNREGALIQESEEEEDMDLAENIYLFVRKTPKHWTMTRIMQVVVL